MEGIGSAQNTHRVPYTGTMRHVAQDGTRHPGTRDTIDLGAAGDFLALKKPILEKGDLEKAGPVAVKAWEATFEPPPASLFTDQYRPAPVLTEKGTVILSRGKELTGIDSMNGEVRWRLKCDDNFCTRPAVAENGTVYAANCDGKLYALDGDTGEKKWSRKWNQIIKTAKDWAQDKFTYNGGVDSLGGYMQMSTRPALSTAPDGSVYGSSIHRVFGFSPNGSRKFNTSPGTWVLSSPAISPSGQVHVVVERPDTWGHAENALVTVDGRSGEEVWAKSLWLRISNQVITVDREGSILIGQESGLGCFSGDTGEPKLSFGSNMTSRIPVPPSVGKDGTHYIVSGRGFDLIVYQPGKSSWTAFFKGGFAATPVEGPYGTVIAVGKDGTGCIFRKEDGEKLASFTCDRGAHGALQMTGDGTLIVSDDRGISAYSLPFIKKGTLEYIRACHENSSTESQVQVEDTFIEIDGVKLPVRMRHISV